MKRVSFVAALTMCLAPLAAHAAVVAYWNENIPAFPDTTFGYVPANFPQAADSGSGTLNLANFDQTIGPANGAYLYIQSFAGTTTNAQFGDPAGGSLSPQVGASSGGGFTNNGMQILISVNTTGYSNIGLSWAQRGTATGFNSRALEYSTNGGGIFIPLAYTGDTGALGSTFATVSPNLTGIAALANNPNVVFRLTLSGGTSTSGNNRFDNILVEGTAIPEPASLLLLAMGSVVLGFSRRRVAE